jgi:uncharacterized protein with FMN-binding domain
MTFGVLTLSYNLGQHVVVANESFSAPTTDTALPTTVATSEPTASNDAVIDAPVISAAPTQPSSSPNVAATKAPPTNAGGSGNTQDGSVVQSGFGTVQVQVTKSGGKISDITMLLANATKGRDAVFSYLIQYAIDANGSNFANVSGATYTTDAFKESLDAALAKF